MEKVAFPITKMVRHFKEIAAMCVKGGHDRNLPLQLNNFEWNFRGLLAASSVSCAPLTFMHVMVISMYPDWWQPSPIEIYFFGSRIN